MARKREVIKGPTLRLQEGPQRAFGSSLADIVIYGGAAGGGKSYALVLEACRNATVKGYSAIIFRRTSPELTGGGSLWEESYQIYPWLKGKPREHMLEWRFESGASIKFSHLQYSKDVYTHQGKQYAFIGFDELTHFEESQFWYLLSRLRSVTGVKPYIRCTTNPNPDSWVRRFIDWWIGEDGYPIEDRAGKLRWFIRVGDEFVWADTREEILKKHPDRKPMSLTFIPAKLADNPALTEKDPDYDDRLKQLTRVERERLRLGNWNIKPAAGMYFKREWVEMIDAAPTKVKKRVRCWDKAATEPGPKNEDPDWTAGPLMSVDFDNTIYIEGMVRFRGTPGKVENRIKNTATQDGRRVTIGHWQDPGAAGKADAHRFTKLLKGYVNKVVQAREDKITYFEPFSSAAENGNVKVVRGKWNEELFGELEAFGSGEGHDDQADGVSLGHKLLIDDKTDALRKLAKR